MNGQSSRGSSEGLNCKGELLNRVLGGVGSSVDQQAFAVHIETCESCRLSQQLCGDFERIGAAPDDSARVARIARLAAASVRTRRPETVIPFPVSRRKPVLRWALVALALVGSAAAAAALTPWFGGLEFEKSPDQSAGMKDHPESTAPAKKLAPVMEQTAQEIDEAEAPEGTDDPVVVALPNKSAEMVVRKNAPASGATAESIFREANLARRQGDSSLAIKLYRQLQSQFPGSPEASLSRVSLGRLYLQSGSSQAAVAQFDSYLGSGSGKSLAAEALYGRARALQALGRSSAEAENWRRLLKSYPNSPYSGEAQRRLQTLR